MSWLFFLGKQRKMLEEIKDGRVYILPLGIRAVKRDEEMSAGILTLLGMSTGTLLSCLSEGAVTLS